MALRALVLILAVLFAVVPAAQAGTVSRDGDRYTFAVPSDNTAAETVWIDRCSAGSDGCASGDPGDYFLISENSTAPVAAAGSQCVSWTPSPGAWLKCPVTGIAGWTVHLGGGNDTLLLYDGFGDSFPTVADGGPGNDSLTTGNGLGDVLVGGAGADSMNGGGGNGDTVSYAGRTDNITFSFASGAVSGGSQDGAEGARDTVGGVEGVIGGDGDDDLRAGAATVPVRLEGGPGGDRLEANSLATTLLGDSGNDQLIGGNAADLLDGGSGNDSLLPDDGADTVLAGVGVDSISSQDGVVDTIDCGGNRDSLLVDLNDSLANCDDPAPPSDPTPPAGPPSGTAPPARLLPTLAFGAKAGAKSTVLRRLRLGAVEPGASVTAKCRTKAGRRCKRTKDYRKAAAPSKLRLTSFEGKALPVGAKLTIQLTKPGMTGSVRVLTIRKRKKPSTVTRCLPPGTTRPAACS